MKATIGFWGALVIANVWTVAGTGLMSAAIAALWLALAAVFAYCEPKQ